MDINSFVIGFAKGKKSGTGFFSTKENNAGGLTYAFKATEGGGGSGGGIELNIAYGDTPPEDTTKLWVKTTQPSGVVVSCNPPVSKVSGNSDVEQIGTIIDAAKANGVSAYCGGKVHFFGGLGTSSSNKSTTHYIIDPETNTVTKCGSYHSTNSETGCGVVGDVIYIIGGKDTGSAAGTKTILSFDTTTDTLTTLSVTLPTALRDMGYASVGNKIYLFGGVINNSSSSDKIYCFDVGSNTITTITTTLPVAGTWRCAFDGNKIFLFYGVLVYEFNEEDYTVKFLGECSETIDEFVTSNGTIYCIYKKDYTNTPIGIFDKDALTIKEVASLPLTAYISVPFVAATDEKIYIGGGYLKTSANSTGYHKSIYCMYRNSLTYEVPNGNLHIVTSVNNAFTIVSNDTTTIESGVAKVYKGNENNEGEPVEAALYKDGAWVTI